MKKKKILFVANGDSGWIGGLYYVKNIMYQFLQYEKAAADFDIYVYTTDANRKLFTEFEDQVNIHYIRKGEKKGLLYRFCDWILNEKLGKNVDSEFWFKVLPGNFDVIYPYVSTIGVLNRNLVSWIPDFQYLHLKELFSESEMQSRESYSSLVAKYHKKLILSSQDALKDYQSVYPEYMDQVYVVPFVSAIDETTVRQDRAAEIAEKYEIDRKYFMAANQFWAHKNHTTLFKAIKRMVDAGHEDVLCVCTGALKDYRNQTYYESLETYIRENHLENNIKILGFIDRNDQIQMMKGSIAVVQPSRFEGWGTVVEDAKTMQKLIVLSDIAVHEEQKTDYCRMFEQLNDEQLAAILGELWETYRTEDVKWGYQIDNAKKYGKLFYDAITS